MAASNGPWLERAVLHGFVGESRCALAERIVSAFAKVRDEHTPHLISLEAPQGWGKTRVIQEAYERLAQGQEEPRYWPCQMVPGEGGNPLQRRHVIYPPLVPIEGEIPMPWMWWGINCDRRRSGRLSQVLADEITQIEQHAEGLLASATRRKQGKEALAGLVLGAAGSLVPLAGVALTGAQSAKDLWRVGQGALQRYRSQEGGREIDPSDTKRLSLQERVLSMLRSLASSELPFFIVVDDAHDSDPSLIGVLEELFAAPMPVPVLVVTAGWPELIGKQIGEGASDSFGRWLEHAHQRDSNRIERISLDRLAPDDAAAIVRHQAAHTDEGVVSALVERADGNPLVLQGLLFHRRVVDRTANGRIELTQRDIQELPNSYRRILEERWEAIDEPVREILAIGALQGREFVEELLRQAGEALEREIAPEKAIALAIDPYAWIAAFDAILRFKELYTYELAYSEARELFTGSEIEEAHRAIASRITTWKADSEVWESLPHGVVQMILRLHVQLGEELSGVRGETADSAFRLSCEAGLVGAYVDAERLARLADEWGGGDDPSKRARWVRGYALAGLGRYSEAKELHEEVYQERLRVLGSSDVETLAAMDSLADLLVDVGEFDRALELQKKVVKGYEGASSDDGTELLLAARENLGRCLFSCGRVSEAAQVQANVIKALERRTDTDEDSLLHAYLRMAQAQLRLGKYARSEKLLKRVIHGFEELYGPDDERPLAAQATLASVFYSSQRLEEARAIQTEVLVAYEGLFGPRHPRTLREGENLAVTEREMGESDIAVRRLESVVTDLVEVVGADNPDTIHARSNLVGALVDVGRTSEAQSLADETLADAERLFGDNHRITMLAAGTAHLVARKLGDHARADELLDRLVTGLERSAGPDHPALLPLTLERARRTLLLGDCSRAHAMAERVARLAAEDLGLEHPTTIEAERLRAAALWSSGDRDAACVAQERARESLANALGHEHDEAVAAAHELEAMREFLDAPPEDESTAMPEPPEQSGPETDDEDDDRYIERVVSALSSLAERRVSPQLEGAILASLREVLSGRDDARDGVEPAVLVVAILMGIFRAAQVTATTDVPFTVLAPSPEYQAQLASGLRELATSEGVRLLFVRLMPAAEGEISRHHSKETLARMMTFFGVTAIFSGPDPKSRFPESRVVGEALAWLLEPEDERPPSNGYVLEGRPAASRVASSTKQRKPRKNSKRRKGKRPRRR